VKQTYRVPLNNMARLTGKQCKDFEGLGAIFTGVPNLRGSSATRFSSKTPKRNRYSIAARSLYPLGSFVAKKKGRCDEANGLSRPAANRVVRRLLRSIHLRHPDGAAKSQSYKSLTLLFSVD
jgi:hypothetical protein